MELGLFTLIFGGNYHSIIKFPPGTNLFNNFNNGSLFSSFTTLNISFTIIIKFNLISSSNGGWRIMILFRLTMIDTSFLCFHQITVLFIKGFGSMDSIIIWSIRWFWLTFWFLCLNFFTLFCGILIFLLIVMIKLFSIIYPILITFWIAFLILCNCRILILWTFTHFFFCFWFYINIFI